ncbi:hypothetical protein T02_1957 [Trichinella nativa]|uniref:Uncharacterized protein n=1 Tax=Trichinella nativa TaxID=6335 RepID=A0A0V1LDN3_9BILA|nr:hypothetical protein T02_1957 [Trichinella nativa]
MIQCLSFSDRDIMLSAKQASSACRIEYNPAGELFAMPLRPINLFDNCDEEESRARCRSFSSLQFVAFYHRQPVDWNPRASDISAERSYFQSVSPVGNSKMKPLQTCLLTQCLD